MKSKAGMTSSRALGRNALKAVLIAESDSSSTAKSFAGKTTIRELFPRAARCPFWSHSGRSHRARIEAMSMGAGMLERVSRICRSPQVQRVYVTTPSDVRWRDNTTTVL